MNSSANLKVPVLPGTFVGSKAANPELNAYSSSLYYLYSPLQSLFVGALLPILSIVVPFGGLSSFYCVGSHRVTPKKGATMGDYRWSIAILQPWSSAKSVSFCFIFTGSEAAISAAEPLFLSEGSSMSKASILILFMILFVFICTIIIVIIVLLCSNDEGITPLSIDARGFRFYQRSRNALVSACLIF